MKRTFKFRYVNEIVGTFVIVCLALAMVAIYSIGRLRGLYEEDIEIYLKFTSVYSAMGLREGAEVRARGSQIGHVTKVAVADLDDVRATLLIDGRYRKFIAANAKAKITRTLGIAGDPYVEILARKEKSLPIQERAVIVVEEEEFAGE